MPTDDFDLDSLIPSHWFRDSPIEVRPIATATEQVAEHNARVRRSNGLDFESMFATVISEYMTQHNVEITMALIKLGFTEPSTIETIRRWFEIYTRS